MTNKLSKDKDELSWKELGQVKLFCKITLILLIGILIGLMIGGY